MSSYVAQTIAILQAASIPMGGIAPPPVPARSTYPYVTVTQIMSKETESLQGNSGLIRTLIQINIHDKVYESAWATREAIKIALRASLGSRLNHNQDNELYNGNDSLHQLICRFFVWWND